MANIGVRLKTIEEQKAVTRSEDLLALLEKERAALSETETMVSSRIEEMGLALEKVTITVQGKTMTAMQAASVIVTMGHQRSVLKNMARGVNLQDIGIPSLKVASDAFKKAIEDVGLVWDQACIELLSILDGISVPESGKLFSQLWTKKPFVMTLVWDANQRCFAKPEGIEFGPELKHIVENVQGQFSNVSPPHGTILIIEGNPGPKGGFNFGAKLRYPPGWNVSDNTTGGNYG